MAKIPIIPTGNPLQTVGFIGSVANVIQGEVPAFLASQRFHAADYAFGFELGSPRNISSLGETILLNGLCFTTNTDPDTRDYAETIAGPDFVTTGICLIPKTAKPTHTLRWSREKSAIPLIECYAEISRVVQNPLFFVAHAVFADFHATAIAKTPIHQENIFTHKKSYYRFPEINRHHVPAFVMGAICNPAFPINGTLQKALEVIFYQNPFDASSTTLQHHAHVLTLKKAVVEVAQITEKVAQQSLHLFAENTTLLSLQADIYGIDALIDLAPAKDYL